MSVDGIYAVIINSQITVPVDFTGVTTQTFADEIKISVRMIDPCKTTTLDQVAVNDMQSFAIGLVERQTLPQFTDFASSTFGPTKDGFSFCGPRNISIKNFNQFDQFLTIDLATNELVLLSNSL